MYAEAMRLPDSEHLARPWRIHALTPDFALEDVWALPTPGGPQRLPAPAGADRLAATRRRVLAVVGVLFAIRWKLGELLGWDDDGRRARRARPDAARAAAG